MKTQPNLTTIAILLAGLNSGFPSLAADPPPPKAAELIERARKIADVETDKFRRSMMFTAIFCTQAAIEDDAGAIATAKESPATLPREKESDLLIIVEEQAGRGRIEAATRTAALIEIPQIRAFAARRLALASDRAGDHAGADRLIREIIAPETQLEAWIKLTRQRREAGRTTQAKRSLAEAVALVAAGKGKPTDERLCDLAVERARLGDAPASREALKAARERADLKTDRVDRAYAYYFIIEAQAKSGDISGAWESAGTLEDEKDVFGTPIKDKGIRAIAEALAEQGRFADSETALGKIGDIRVRAAGLAGLAKAEVGAKASDRARRHLDKAFARMDAAPDVRGNLYTTIALSNIGMTWLQLGDKASALRVARLDDGQSTENLRMEIASAHAADGDITVAIDLLKSIKRESLRTDCVLRVARERARRDDPQTLKWAESLPSASERLHALLGMAEGVSARPRP